MSAPLSGKRLVWIGSAVLLFLALGIFVAFVFIGRKQLIRSSLLSEGRRRLGDFGEGLARCAATAGLPPSSPLVPADFKKLAGQGYRATASDWEAEAFRCAQFAPTTGYFQIGWTRQTAETGMVQAFGDIDRDGRLDTKMSAPVECKMEPPEKAGEPAKVIQCGVGPVQEEAMPPSMEDHP